MSAKHFSQAPAMQIDTSKKYTATMDTSDGVMSIELFASEDPITVNNFVNIATNNGHSEFGLCRLRFNTIGYIKFQDQTRGMLNIPGEFIDISISKCLLDCGVSWWSLIVDKPKLKSLWNEFLA